MFRIDVPSATPDHKFTGGSPTGAIPATTVSPEWLNAVQEEIAHVIEQSGLTLSKADSGQLWDALQSLSSQGAFGVGQTLVDVTASRAKNIIYTNTTGRPIAVYIRFVNDVGATGRLAVNDEIVASGYSTATTLGLGVTAIIPPGANYRTSESGTGMTIQSWREYR